jgi:REP element-mobilizing transposase RayT
MADGFRRQPPRLAEVFQKYDARLYFVTFNTMHRSHCLANERVHSAFRIYCETGVAKARIAVGRYVIMPDHVHLFVSGDASFDLSLWVRGLKRAISKSIVGVVTPAPTTGVVAAVPAARVVTPAPAAGVVAAVPAARDRSPLPPRIWQPGFFDHLMRSSESYAQKWIYVRENPVRAELVTRAEDWPYQGEIVPIDRA